MDVPYLFELFRHIFTAESPCTPVHKNLQLLCWCMEQEGVSARQLIYSCSLFLCGGFKPYKVMAALTLLSVLLHGTGQAVIRLGTGCYEAWYRLFIRLGTGCYQAWYRLLSGLVQVVIGLGTGCQVSGLVQAVIRLGTGCCIHTVLNIFHVIITKQCHPWDKCCINKAHVVHLLAVYITGYQLMCRCNGCKSGIGHTVRV